VIWCRRAQNPGEAQQRRAADKLGGSWHELDTGHYPMLSMPGELTQILLARVAPPQARHLHHRRRPDPLFSGFERG
jgi:hypothetical protein